MEINFTPEELAKLIQETQRDLKSYEEHNRMTTRFMLQMLRLGLMDDNRKEIYNWKMTYHLLQTLEIFNET